MDTFNNIFNSALYISYFSLVVVNMSQIDVHIKVSDNMTTLVDS